MPFPLERVRAETPGCARVLHLNNAGAALMPAPVLDAVQTHLQREAETGGYEAAAEAEGAQAHTYDAVARLVGAATDEIALLKNATRAWDMAFYGLPLRPGDRIVTARAAYASNAIAMLHRARQTGAEIVVIPNDAHGQVDLERLEAALDERVRLVALTHMPTNGGLVNPAAEVGALTRQAGIPFLLDACQSAGQLPLDVDALGCDMLSATGRKFLRGPRGTGFLYVRRAFLDRLEPPFLDLHAATWTAPDAYTVRDDARRFETWEGFVAGKIGLGVAVDYALDLGLEAIWARVQQLADQLRTLLGELPGVRVHDQGVVRSGIVTFSHPDHQAEHLKARLRAEGINVSVSSPSSTLLDATARSLPSMVRASVHYYNTDDELARFGDTLRALLD